MEGNSIRRLEEAEKELHLTQHRLTVLEQEQLPRRVAYMEPIVQRLEHKLDDLGVKLGDLEDKIEIGLSEVKTAIREQKSLQKGVVATIIALTGLIQLVPYLKDMMK